MTTEHPGRGKHYLISVSINLVTATEYLDYTMAKCTSNEDVNDATDALKQLSLSDVLVHVINVGQGDSILVEIQCK